MSYKVKHYAAQTPVAAFRTNWEAIVVELLVGIISTVMAISGFKGGLLLMAVPLTLVAIMSFAMAIHAIVTGILDKRERIRALEDEIKAMSEHNSE